MDCIRYTENKLFDFAFANADDKELLEVLIKDFGLDVNWRKSRYYDTLLYSSLKNGDVSLVEFLLSKGACINASLGGYPEKGKKSHGNLSILDVCSGFQTIQEVGGKDWLIKRGAISFENIPEKDRQDLVENVDITREASDEIYIYRATNQVKIAIMLAPDKVKEKLRNFAGHCERNSFEDFLELEKDKTINI